MTELPRITKLCLLCGAPLLSGCLSLGLVQSAQTLPPGEVQHQFGLEWFRTSSGDGDIEPYSLPFAMPFYGLRAGVADRVDLGFRTNVTFTNVGFDTKVQAIDTDHFELAFDPTVQYAWAWGLAHLPLLIGLTISSSFQVILSARGSWVFPLVESVDPERGLREAFGTSSQGMVGGGLGLYARVSDRFAILPEVQAIRGFGETDPVTVSFTLGFSFGDQPGVEPAPERAPVPPTRHPRPPGAGPSGPTPGGPRGPAATPPGYGDQPRGSGEIR